MGLVRLNRTRDRSATPEKRQFSCLRETLFVDETKSANLGLVAEIPPLNCLILDYLNELNQTATFLAFISPAYLLHYDTMGIICATSQRKNHTAHRAGLLRVRGKGSSLGTGALAARPCSQGLARANEYRRPFGAPSRSAVSASELLYGE